VVDVVLIIVLIVIKHVVTIVMTRTDVISMGVIHLDAHSASDLPAKIAKGICACLTQPTVTSVTHNTVWNAQTTVKIAEATIAALRWRNAPSADSHSV
jgi:hypothetical protein